MSNPQWQQSGPTNHTLVNRDRSRYTIDRLGQRWVLSFLPTGNAEGGREAVPWLPGLSQTLGVAKESCEEHDRSRVTVYEVTTTVVSQVRADSIEEARRLAGFVGKEGALPPSLRVQAIFVGETTPLNADQICFGLGGKLHDGRTQSWV